MRDTRPVSDLEFRVLGPVEAVREGDTLPLGGRQQQALLALLLLEPSRAVTVDRLVEELWHGHPAGWGHPRPCGPMSRGYGGL